MNPYLILAAAAAFVINGFYWHAHGRAAERAEWTARIATERADAANAARNQERAIQENANAAIRTQSESIARINAGLRTELDGLRKRPERPTGMPDTGRVACAGGTGAELSRPDAEFLAGEAARADELRAGLAACYQVIDGAR